MPLVDAHCQHRPTEFVIVGWKMGQDEVTVWLKGISCNALFEVLLKQRQMPGCWAKKASASSRVLRMLRLT